MIPERYDTILWGLIALIAATAPTTAILWTI